MSEVRVKGFKALQRALVTDSKSRQRRVERAFRRTAQRGAAVIRRAAPVAFSELRDSVHAEGYRIIADAPHAAAIEDGSRPHWPPLEPLIKWVKLRGMQGLASPKSLARLSGGTTAGHAQSVAAQLKAMQRPGYGLTEARGGRRRVVAGGAMLDLDAPKRIAMAIAAKIAKSGTKPHHFVAKSMPQIYEILHEEVTAALPDRWRGRGGGSFS